MKRAIPLLVVLLGFAVYVYVFHLRPAREFDPAVRTSGTIEATTVVVSAKVAARVASLMVEEGMSVEAGQVVATLVCEDLQARKAQAEAQVLQALAAQAQSEAGLAQARAQTVPLGVQRDLASRDYRRTAKMAEDAAVAERSIDQAQSAMAVATEQVRAAELATDVARRAVAVARSQVDLARRSVAVVDTQLAECTLTAPRAGVVLTRVREVGELALPGAAVVKLGGLDEVHTWIYVANEDIGRVSLGQQVRVVADTYPGRVFLGTVARVSQQAEFTPRSIQTKQDRVRLVYGVKVMLPNIDHALMPGMPVEAELVEAHVATQRRSQR